MNRARNRIGFNAIAIVGGLAVACAQPRRPNVILISIDCLNQRQFAGAMKGGYAPNLSRLRDDSVAFSRAYSQAPWTTPSHMSMLTGLYPSQHGRDVPYGMMIRWNDFYSRVPSFSTLGETLRTAGYRTAAFVGQGSISGVYGLSQGFSVFEERRKKSQLTDLSGAIDRVAEWLGEVEQEPFFLFFHTYDLHQPRPKGLDSDESDIGNIDRYLGRLFLELRTRDLYDRSLLIVTGDHGSNMIEVEGKCCVHGAGHYEENLRVPLLLKLPGRSQAREESVLARHIDLVPTVLDVVDLDAPYDGPGGSLLRRLENKDAAGDIVSFSEADGRCALRRALVTDRYKYIYAPRDEIQALYQANPLFFDETCPDPCRDLHVEELYDLHKDPFEKRNLLLAGNLDRERASALERLRLEMALHLNLPPRYSKSVMTGPRRPLDDEELEELEDSLRTLGYIR